MPIALVRAEDMSFAILILSRYRPICERSFIWTMAPPNIEGDLVGRAEMVAIEDRSQRKVNIGGRRCRRYQDAFRDETLRESDLDNVPIARTEKATPPLPPLRFPDDAFRYAQME